MQHSRFAPRYSSLRRRFYGILKCNANTSGRNVAVAYSTAVSNVTNIFSFATRFALRSGERVLSSLSPRRTSTR